MSARTTFTSLLAVALLPALAIAADSKKPADPPTRDKPIQVGDKAPTLTLTSEAGKNVDLAKVYQDGPTVLVVLRGYPGYQCPACSRQAAGFIGAADKFKQAGAKVVMVYPGGAANLGERAGEFLAAQKRSEKSLPEPVVMTLDPDYQLTNAYGLRWDAPRETAYPSTFIIGKDGKVAFAEVSRTHGGRVAADKVLKELGKKKS